MSVVRVSYGPVTSLLCVSDDSRSKGSDTSYVHLVKSVTHRTTVHVVLDTSIDLNVTDMLRRDEDYVSGRG